MRCPSLLRLLLILAPFLFSPYSSSKTWKDWARFVGPAESRRLRSIENLKKIKDLDQVLVNQLGGKNQGYALDVISALRKRNLIPQILEKLPGDESGFVALTVNSLITTQNRNEILWHYSKLLKEEHKVLSPATIVAMLEPFGRLGVELDLEILKPLARHSFPEVKMSVIQLVRTHLLQFGNPKSIVLLAEFEKQKSYQVTRMLNSLREEVSKFPKWKNLLTEPFPQSSSRKPKFRIEGYDIQVFFGYKDARPGRFVGDRHERLDLIQYILKPCGLLEQNLCGFRRHSRDSDLFLKKLNTQHSKEPLRLHLRVVGSSVMTDDDANRLNPLQKIKSQQTHSEFLDSLRKADIVFYNGHSRFGAGPDFSPPRLKKGGRVDANFYKNQQKGITATLEALEDRQLDILSEPLDTLGFFSCQSSKHFHKSIKSKKVKNVISSPRLLHYSDALGSSKKELSKILGSLLKLPHGSL